MRQVKREREVVSFTKDCLESAILFPHSVATKEYICRLDTASCCPFCSVVTRKDFFMSKNTNIRRLCYLALLIAMNIVFVRLLSFQTDVTRLDFGFVPLAIAGAMFGPLWGAVTAGASDILGMLINSKGMAYFFPWTLNAILHGLLYGLFLYRKEKSWSRILLMVLTQGFLIDLLLGSLWAAMYRGAVHIYGVVFVERLIMICIKMPFQFISLSFLLRILKPHIKEL